MSSSKNSLFPSLIVDAGLDFCNFFLVADSDIFHSSGVDSLANVGKSSFITHTFKPELGLCESIDLELSKFLSSHGTALTEIKSIVSCAGPGSFTGLRTGMSFCRAVSQVLSIPIVLISNMFAASLSRFIETGNSSVRCITTANTEEFFYCEYNGVDVRDFKPLAEITSIKKDLIATSDCLSLEDLKLEEIGVGYLQSLIFANRLYLEGQLDKKESINKFFYQIQYITDDSEVIEPLYVKSVVAKTLLERGVKSLLDQE